MPQVKVLGFAWYKRENFVRLKAMFTDGDKLHDTYDEWLAAAERGCKSAELEGKRVIRVDIDPDGFSQWCRAKGLNMNAEARVKYANLIAAQKFGAGDVN